MLAVAQVGDELEGTIESVRQGTGRGSPPLQPLCTLGPTKDNCDRTRQRNMTLFQANFLEVPCVHRDISFRFVEREDLQCVLGRLNKQGPAPQDLLPVAWQRVWSSTPRNVKRSCIQNQAVRFAPWVESCKGSSGRFGFS